MRIAQLSADWRPTGGVATYVRMASRALADAGHEVLVVHGDAEGAGDPVPGVTAIGVSGALRFSASGDPAATRAVMGALEDFAPDVAHFHSTHNFSLEDAVRERVPAVKTMHVHEYCPAGTKYHFASERICTFST